MSWIELHLEGGGKQQFIQGQNAFFKPETPEVTTASSATAAYFLHNTTRLGFPQRRKP